MAGPDLTPPNRERAFNAPWPLLVLVGAILALYLIQSRIGADWPDRFGLRGLRSLVRDVGGELDVTSAVGEGTSVRMAVRR